jgi:hypothetical protein
LNVERRKAREVEEELKLREELAKAQFKAKPVGARGAGVGGSWGWGWGW